MRVVTGASFDVAVDIRTHSATYGPHVGAIVSAQARNQILVPAAVAHGFCTLEQDTEVIYKVTGFSSAEHDRGVLWNDPAVGIDWPVNVGRSLLSGNDRKCLRLIELDCGV